MVSKGQYSLGVYSKTKIQTGEELTFDYMSVTDNIE